MRTNGRVPRIIRVHKELETQDDNLAFEREVEEWLSMGEEVKASYLVKLLMLLEPRTWIYVQDDTAMVAYHLTTIIISKKFINRDVKKVTVNRKGKNQLTFIRENNLFVVTSI